jgi:hypothetical protein
MQEDMIKWTLQTVQLKNLHRNKGQIAGVPKNPRVIKDDKFQSLKKSISEFPDMLNLREIVCYDNNGELVVVGGNMRLVALQELGEENVTAKILSQETSASILRRFTIADNTPYGEWDDDALNAEWDKVELAEWGIDSTKDWEEEEVTKGETETDAPQPKTFTIGDFKVPLTDKEFEELSASLVHYVGENVLPDGFFAHLLQIQNDATRGFFF